MGYKLFGMAKKLGIITHMYTWFRGLSWGLANRVL